jgi:hypothetical protein
MGTEKIKCLNRELIFNVKFRKIILIVVLSAVGIYFCASEHFKEAMNIGSDNKQKYISQDRRQKDFGKLYTKLLFRAMFLFR